MPAPNRQAEPADKGGKKPLLHNANSRGGVAREREGGLLNFLAWTQKTKAARGEKTVKKDPVWSYNPQGTKVLRDFDSKKKRRIGGKGRTRHQEKSP